MASSGTDTDAGLVPDQVLMADHASDPDLGATPYSFSRVVDPADRVDPCQVVVGLGDHRRADGRRLAFVVAECDQAQMVGQLRHDRSCRCVAPVPQSGVVEDHQREMRPGRR